MDLRAQVAQASAKLQTAVSVGKPDPIRAAAQGLNEALYNLSQSAKEAYQLKDEAKTEAMNGLQLLAALASHGMISLLLDGPKLFPMLVAYLKHPWSTTGVSPIAFAIAYNLCQLNGARLEPFSAAGGIVALVEYIRESIDANPSSESPDAITQKRNLALSMLYQIGSPQNPLQERFCSEGGLTAVLDHINTSKSALLFLSNFITLESPPAAINIIISHADFAALVDSLYKEDVDSDDDEDNEEQPDEEKKAADAQTLLVIQILRNLCLLQGSADSILPLLSRFLGHNLTIADEALSALSNLAGTQTIDYRYAWDSSLIGMTLSRANQICERLIEVAAADITSPIANRNAAGRRSVLQRVLQVIRSEECLKVASENTAAGRPSHGQDESKENGDAVVGDNSDSDSDADEDYEDDLVFTRDDAVHLAQMALLNKDLLESNQNWARTFARYFSILPPSVTWSEAENEVEILKSGNAVVQRDLAGPPAYIDSDFDLGSALHDVELAGNVNFQVMWRRISSFQQLPSSSTIPKASYDTVSLGPIPSPALSAILSGLAQFPIKLATMFKLPATEREKWSTGPITIKLHNLQNGKEVSVAVDDRIPCFTFSKPCGVWTGSNQYWLPLIEKACAKLLGGYSKLKNISLDEASMLLTGIRAIKCKIPPEDKFQLALESELADGSLMYYSTIHAPHSYFLVNSLDQTSTGVMVSAYNATLFDPRRGWDPASGHMQLQPSVLFKEISGLYKLSGVGQSPST